MQHADAIDADDRIPGADAEKEISILGESHVRIETADLQQGRAPEKHDADLGKAEVQTLGCQAVNEIGGSRRNVGEWLHILRCQLGLAVCEGRPRLGLQGGELGFHVAGKPGVVVIEEAHIRSGAHAQAGIPSRGRVPVPDPEVGGPVLGRDLAGFVGAVIGHHDDLAG